MWRKNEPEFLPVEKKRQISGMDEDEADEVELKWGTKVQQGMIMMLRMRMRMMNMNRMKRMMLN